MANVFDYLDWRGDISFDGAPFCEVDALILAEIAYVPFEKIKLGRGITIEKAAEEFFKTDNGAEGNLGLIMPADILPLFERISKTERFRGVILRDYVSITDKDVGEQFSACTFVFGRRKIYVAFRGTDDSVVGWEENFNMAFKCPVPAQLSAVNYINKVSRGARSVIAGGHSKGGNLAVYGSSLAVPSVKKKIERVYNFDGPGFIHGFFDSTEYLEIESRVCMVVPESSVVGMLLEHEESYEVIKSHATGLMQHDGCSWEVLGGKFIYLDTVTHESRLIDSTLREWLDSLSMQEREKVVDSVYEVLVATNSTTLTELTADKVKLVKAWGNLDPKVKSIVLKCIGIFLKESRPGKKK